MELQFLTRIYEAPEKGLMLAYLREEILFTRYHSIEDVKEKLAGRNVLEIHLFDKEKEYRVLSTTSKRFPSGNIEEVADFPYKKDDGSCFMVKTMMDREYAKVSDRLWMINHLSYDENGAAVVDNYRLTEEV